MAHLRRTSDTADDAADQIFRASGDPTGERNTESRSALGVSVLSAPRTSACARRSITPPRATPRAELHSVERIEARLRQVKPGKGGEM
jgi:hypothetical protein